MKKYLVFTQNTVEEINKLNVNNNPLTNLFFCADNYGNILQDILKQNNSVDQNIIDVIDSILDGSDIFSKTTKKPCVINAETNGSNFTRLTPNGIKLLSLTMLCASV